MKRPCARFNRGLTSAFLVVSALFGLPGFILSADQGWLDTALQAPTAAYEKAEAYARMTQKANIEAMQEGPPPEPRDAAWSKQDLQNIRDRNARLLNSNQDLANAQQQLANSAANLLGQMPPDHPRYKEIQNRLKQIGDQMPDTQKHIQEYKQKLAIADAAVERWKQREDPSYVPPAPPPTRVHPGSRASASNTSDTSVEPPSDPPMNQGGGSGPDLAALKQQEAEQEAAVRSLGKGRQSAVNQYLDDPSQENHDNAQALRQKLDGMVDTLNQLRGQVDSLEGGEPRSKLHVRSASAIAKEHKRNKENGTNTDGAQNQPAAGACGGPGKGSGTDEQSSNMNENAPHTYEEVAPDRTGGGAGKLTGPTTQAASMGRRGRTASHAQNGSQMHRPSNGMNRTSQTNRRSPTKNRMTTANAKSLSSAPHRNASTARTHVQQHQAMPQTANRQQRKKRQF